MAPRPYWSGTIRMSLVAFSVDLYTATSERRIALHRVHRETGERVRNQMVVPDHGPVEAEEVVKGYEYEKGQYVLLEDEELKQVRLESKRTIELAQFVDRGEIDTIRYDDHSYFVVPERGGAAEATYRVVRDALRKTKRVGLGQLVMGGRERIVALRPCGKGMVLQGLRYDDEVRRAASYFEDIEDGKVNQEEVELAAELIGRKAAAFDPAAFTDHYKKALRDLVEAKLKDGEVIEQPEPRQSAQVIDLMEALKRSLGDKGRAAAKAEPKRTARPKARGKKASPARRKRA
jgi:DNA end-binding protein Ku